jgi:hypothetical protein
LVTCAFTSPVAKVRSIFSLFIFAASAIFSKIQTKSGNHLLVLTYTIFLLTLHSKSAFNI